VISPGALLLGVLLPAVVAGLLLLAGRRRAGGGWSALATGAGYVAGHVGLRGWRGLPPSDATDWILVLALGATAAAIALCGRGPLRPRATWPQALVMALLGAAAAWCLQRRVAAAGGAPARDALLAGLLIAMVWSVVQRWRPATRSLVPAVLLLAAAGGAAAIGLSGSQSLAQHAGALAATLGAATVVALCGWAPALWDGLIAVACLLLGSLLLAGQLFADLPRPCTSAVGGSVILAALVQRVAPRAGLRGGAAVAAALVAQALVLAWAVQLALAASPSFEDL
jgi:hypothetical protein